MAVVLNQGRPNEITLRLFIRSEEYGTEIFDHHETVEEMLDSIRNVIELAAQDGKEREVGIEVLPPSQ